MGGNKDETRCVGGAMVPDSEATACSLYPGLTPLRRQEQNELKVKLNVSIYRYSTFFLLFCFAAVTSRKDTALTWIIPMVLGFGICSFSVGLSPTTLVSSGVLSVLDYDLSSRAGRYIKIYIVYRHSAKKIWRRDFWSILRSPTVQHEQLI